MTWRDLIDKYLSTPGSCIRTQTDAAIEQAAAKMAEDKARETAPAAPAKAETPAPKQ